MATKRRRIPMMLCGADERTRKAFALWRTGPHMAWHLVGLFETREDACDEAQRYVGDMHTDGLVVRPVSLAPEVMRWERKR